MRRLFSVSLLLLLGVWIPADATRVVYDLTDLGSGRYRYEYTLTNDSLSFPIDEFTIYFPFALFAGLGGESAPNDWDPLVAPPVDMLGDGFFDALSLTATASIAPGVTLGGFSVAFDWLGGSNALPGSQRFEIVDPLDYTKPPFDAGDTTRAVNVPEPSALVLLAIGLAAIATSASTRRKPLH